LILKQQLTAFSFVTKTDVSSAKRRYLFDKTLKSLLVKSLAYTVSQQIFRPYNVTCTCNGIHVHVYLRRHLFATFVYLVLYSVLTRQWHEACKSSAGLAVTVWHSICYLLSPSCAK